MHQPNNISSADITANVPASLIHQAQPLTFQQLINLKSQSGQSNHFLELQNALNLGSSFGKVDLQKASQLEQQRPQNSAQISILPFNQKVDLKNYLPSKMEQIPQTTQVQIQNTTSANTNSNNLMNQVDKLRQLHTQGEAVQFNMIEGTYNTANQFDLSSLPTDSKSDLNMLLKRRNKFSFMDSDQVQESGKKHDETNPNDDQVNEFSKEFGDKDHINSRVYNKRVIKILQKHFLAKISHPYINKGENLKIANETGLTKQQVLSWFTNIRKRKYQKLLTQAQKTGRDIEYVKHVMKLMFQKNYISDDSSNNSDEKRQLSAKQQEHEMNIGPMLLQKYAQELQMNPEKKINKKDFLNLNFKLLRGSQNQLQLGSNSPVDSFDSQNQVVQRQATSMSKIINQTRLHCSNKISTSDLQQNINQQYMQNANQDGMQVTPQLKLAPVFQDQVPNMLSKINLAANSNVQDGLNTIQQPQLQQLQTQIQNVMPNQTVPQFQPSPIDLSSLIQAPQQVDSVKQNLLNNPNTQSLVELLNSMSSKLQQTKSVPTQPAQIIPVCAPPPIEKKDDVKETQDLIGLLKQLKTLQSLFKLSSGAQQGQSIQPTPQIQPLPVATINIKPFVQQQQLTSQQQFLQPLLNQMQTGKLFQPLQASNQYVQQTDNYQQQGVNQPRSSPLQNYNCQQQQQINHIINLAMQDRQKNERQNNIEKVIDLQSALRILSEHKQMANQNKLQ